MIRALTLQQPLAQLVALGRKCWETRSRMASYRVVPAINAALAIPLVHANWRTGCVSDRGPVTGDHDHQRLYEQPSG